MEGEMESLPLLAGSRSTNAKQRRGSDQPINNVEDDQPRNQPINNVEDDRDRRREPVDVVGEAIEQCERYFIKPYKIWLVCVGWDNYKENPSRLARLLRWIYGQ